SYDVSGGAQVLVRDLWYEGGAGPGLANVHGRAVFTMDGARIASPPNGVPPAFNIQNLDGRVAILSSQIDDRMEASGNGSHAKVLALGVVAERHTPDYFSDKTNPRAETAMLNSRQLSNVPGNRTSATPNVGSPSSTFIREMLRHTRSQT